MDKDYVKSAIDVFGFFINAMLVTVVMVAVAATVIVLLK